MLCTSLDYNQAYKSAPVAGVVGAASATAGWLNGFRRLKNWYCSRKLWYSADANAAESVALPSLKSVVACPTILQMSMQVRHAFLDIAMRYVSTHLGNAHQEGLRNPDSSFKGACSASADHILGSPDILNSNLV